MQPNTKRSFLRHPAFHVGVILLLFIGISLAYFYPAAFEGRKLFQMDGAGASGTAQDVIRLEEETGHRSLWTGSLFSGMPMYQISPSYPSGEMVKGIKSAYRLSKPIPLLPGDTYLVFMLLIGFYIFMRAWGFRRGLSVLGAVMWAFSSYFLILIDAGHIWKLEALCYIPPTIAGLVLAFRRKKYGLAFVVTALFTALQIMANHIQMSYYFAFVMLAMVIGWALEAHRKGNWRHFGISLGVVLAAALVGVLVNSSNLYHTWQYSKHTMRGGSEIVQQDVQAQPQHEVNDKGLDKAYITQWSYGIGEMLTFIIPDAKGGATGHIGYDAPGMSNISPRSAQFVAQQNRYWGNQPFTAGPVYVGIIVVALAIFACIVLRGPMKWAIIGVTLLTIFLSWGHNMMWLSSLFIDYFPLYDKFRTVSSILVVAEFTLPLLAIAGLSYILKDPERLHRQRKAAIISLSLTGGVALLFAIFPSLSGSFLSRMETEGYAPYLQQSPEVGLLLQDLKTVRHAIFTADAWRSVLFLVIGALILYAYSRRKLSSRIALLLLGAVTLVDLWTVDKRYLNDSKYLAQEEVSRMAHTTHPTDELILRDSTEHRVMNLTVDTFNDATTSYLHRSVGGYHAAKLQRYQDVIMGYLSKQNLNVLRALNTKYYIVPDSARGKQVVVDTEVYGDAWFVTHVQTVKGAQEEFDALGVTPLDRIAVVAPPYDQHVQGTSLAADSASYVRLTSYTPDRLVYTSSNSSEGLAVFSEIFYPDGWYATIDGRPAEILRADYLLRALIVPAGSHTITFEFDPKSVHVTETIGYIATAILILSAVGLVIVYFLLRRKRRQALHTEDD